MDGQERARAAPAVRLQDGEITTEVAPQQPERRPRPSQRCVEVRKHGVSPNGQRITNFDQIIALIQHPQRGYSEVMIYQPDSRYWPFQFIEGGWLLVLSLLLLAATVWLVRRRAA